MQRRDFLGASVLVGGTFLVSPSIVFASSKNPFGIDDKPRIFSVQNNYNIAPSDEVAQLWIPLPMDTDYHKMLKLSYEGDFDEAYVSQDNPYNTRLLYVKWDKGSKTRELFISYDVIMQQRSVNLANAKSSTSYPDDVKEFLKGTPHTPVSEFLTKFASDITKNAKTPIQKAESIYDWVVKNMYRDESVKGCGLGDATRILEEKAFGGKCTDISSVFVALLRNAGIPAREVFGIRAGKSLISKSCGSADENGVANNTGWQHCRTEFYISGIGWVPADPADVTKVKLQEKLTDNDKKVQDVKKYFFGNWEMNWIAFNYARDFILNPKPSQYPLNMLGYPYGEIGEDVLDYYEPKSFAYSYKSTEIK
jgi:transglutaminase-like putative cysteine protease